MTLAEALLERANIKSKISELRDRIDDNILVQEDSSPTEDPLQLMPELDSSIQKLEKLVSAINRTNSETVIDGESITSLIARRDMLNLKYEAYENFARTARKMSNRARGTEIKIVSCVDYNRVQSLLDKTAKDLRELDVKLQKANWLTELKTD